MTIDEGTYPCFLNSFCINLSAAVLLRLDWTRQSRTSPSASTARQRYLPAADLYKHLVQMPTIIRSWPEASEPPCIAVSELENPTTHGLVGDVEAALG